MATIKARLKIRAGTAAQWSVANPVLLSGEPGFETDTKRLRFGDGSTAFTALPYIDLNTSGYQVADADLAAIAALGYTSGAFLIKKTAANTYSLIAITAAGEALLDDANDAVQRATLGLVIGTNVQAYNARLADISALSPTKGLLPVGNGTIIAGLEVGSNFHQLIADSTQPTGMRWGDWLDWTSSESNLAMSTEFAFAHGFGAKPRFYEAFLRCASAINGFSAEMELKLGGYQDSSAQGLGIYADTTNVYVRTAGTVATYGPSGYVNLTAGSSWKLFVRAKR